MLLKLNIFECVGIKLTNLKDAEMVNGEDDPLKRNMMKFHVKMKKIHYKRIYYLFSSS